ncbi:MAG: TonB-dependent receptor [Anaerolineae bacterium]|nr:TonB-dependent receptor [Anaerolineae bacterium]
MNRMQSLRTRLRPTLIALASTGLLPCLAQAQDAVLLPRVDVIGSHDKLPEIAGAGDILDEKLLESSRVFTVNEALRKVPGVNVRDEEGFGMRPNIGMRGLNPTRSTKITLLEDGMPLAYAPYGDNASYYHPMIDRYDRIEVLKGAGSLLFGPQTTGGIINYITPDAPRRFGGYLKGAVGNRDYLNGHLNVGGNGFLLDLIRKQGDGSRNNLEHELNDLNLKYTAALGRQQAITLRANYYTEDSTVTYSGLTQAEFTNLGARYNPFKNDKFDVERTGLSATHEIDFGAAQLTTNVYWMRFDRDWWRQSSSSTDGQCGTGTFTVNGVSASFANHRLAGRPVDPSANCNSVQGRLRSYDTWGIEPRLTVRHGLGEFKAGAKAHFEEQKRRQVNGSSPTARSGTLAENNLRKTDAYSLFLANRFDFGAFSVTPILRHERIEAERVNRLTGARGSTTISKTLPGLGVTWNPQPDLTVFASVHRGFAPPRVEDLIDNTTGTATDVDPEKSTNYELGLRARPMPGVSVQAALFRNDYTNLIAVGSIAGGSTPLSQGKALFQGLELGAQAQTKAGFYGRLAYTWLPEAEQKSPFVNVATKAVISGSAAGLRQPYAPEHTLTAAVGYRLGGFDGSVEAQHVGKQYSDFANTTTPAASGQTGIIPAWTVWNAAANYQFDKALTGFVSVKNLTDKTYIVDRTRGIQVGMPRLVQVGVKYAF